LILIVYFILLLEDRDSSAAILPNLQHKAWKVLLGFTAQFRPWPPPKLGK
jgi:hypothetical protein